MRQTLLLSATIFILLLCTNCVKTDYVYGKGTITTKIDTLEMFTGNLILDVECPIMIDSGKPIIAMTTDENLQRHFEFEYVGGSLRIYQNEEYQIAESDLSLKLTLPSLLSIQVEKGDVISTLLPDTSFTGVFRGESQFKSPINLHKASILIEESAMVTFTGSVNNIDLKITSNQTQELSEMVMANANLDIHSSVDTKLHVKHEVDGFLKGAGNLYLIYPTPLETIERLGSGKVIYMGNDI